MTLPRQDLLPELPPFSFTEGSLREALMRTNPTKLHLIILGILYGLLGLVASIEGTLYIRGGIGILQNPPFFAHLLFGVASIPLIHILVARLSRLTSSEEERAVFKAFRTLVENSRMKVSLFSITFLIGLLALAYSFVLAASYATPIYDSPRFPVTFSIHAILRSYYYLLCYPFVFSAVPTLAFYLFRSIQKVPVPYQPFHPDGTGGLRKYFVAIDRPVYAVQSFSVLIAVMNYVGWGGMVAVPKLLAIAVPIVVTLLAVSLFVHFQLVLAAKKREELWSLRSQQMELYVPTKQLARMKAKDCLELLERIDATERLIASVTKGGRRGLQKYFVNLGVLVLSQVSKPVFEILVQRLLGTAP